VASSKQRFNEDTQNKKVCFTINDYYQPRNYVSKILTHQAAIPLLQISFLTKAVVIVVLKEPWLTTKCLN